MIKCCWVGGWYVLIFWTNKIRFIFLPVLAKSWTRVLESGLILMKGLPVYILLRYPKKWIKIINLLIENQFLWCPFKVCATYMYISSWVCSTFIPSLPSYFPFTRTSVGQRNSYLASLIITHHILSSLRQSDLVASCSSVSHSLSV